MSAPILERDSGAAGLSSCSWASCFSFHFRPSTSHDGQSIISRPMETLPPDAVQQAPLMAALQLDSAAPYHRGERLPTAARCLRRIHLRGTLRLVENLPFLLRFRLLAPKQPTFALHSPSRRIGSAIALGAHAMWRVSPGKHSQAQCANGLSLVAEISPLRVALRALRRLRRLHGGSLSSRSSSRSRRVSRAPSRASFEAEPAPCTLHKMFVPSWSSARA